MRLFHFLPAPACTNYLHQHLQPAGRAGSQYYIQTRGDYPQRLSPLSRLQSGIFLSQENNDPEQNWANLLQDIGWAAPTMPVTTSIPTMSWLSTETRPVQSGGPTAFHTFWRESNWPAGAGRAQVRWDDWEIFYLDEVAALLCPANNVGSNSFHIQHLRWGRAFYS